MTTQNDLIRAIIDKKIQEEIQKSQMEQQNRQNPLDRINGISSKVGNWGENISNTGSFLSNNFSSMNKIGNGMQTFGNAMKTGANAVQKAVPTSSALMKNIATNVGSKIGSALGIGSAGATGAAATTGATAGATAAGTTAATTAGTAGASAGAGAAGGAAAGGSAAGGAAAAGPIGALIALGVMALQGTNRKRAKQAGQQAQQLAQAQVDIAKQRLAQTGQVAEMLGNPQQKANDYLSQFDGDTRTIIDNYINSQTPDNSQTPIASAIDNTVQGSQIPATSILNNSAQNPQMVNAPAQTEEATKRGIFDKIADGLTDFLAGYKDNRENGFDPNNLRPVDNKGFMQRMGEGVGTVTRMAQNPVTQGLVAGGLSTALTGNPLYGLGMANKFANNKMNSNLYQQILKNQGVDFKNYNGVITADDMSKILSANKYQKGFMTRKDYDRLRLENGLISIDEYNQSLSAPDYNPDEMVNISGLETVSKAGRNMQQNKNDKSANYYRAKNDGKNVIKVEYGEKPDSHNYTHVTYGAKPESKSTTHITYGEKPQSHNNGGKKDNTPRIKVKSPDGKVGSIPASQLAEAIKKGFKKL